MKSPASSRRHTAVGLLLTGIMLFPVYWMLNVSLTLQQDMRKSPPDLFPLHPTFEGYRAVLHDQMPIGTSLLIGLGTVAATLVLAAPAGYSLAKLRPRGGGVMGLALLVAQIIPGIVMAMGFYGIFLKLPAELLVGPDHRGLHHRRALRRHDLHGVHVGHPRPAHRRRAHRRRGYLAHLLVRRCGEPQRRGHRLAVQLPVGLVRLRLRQHPRRWRRRSSPDHPRHLPLHRQQQPGMGNAIMATAVVASVPAAVLLVLAQRYVAAGVTAGAVKD